MCVCEIESDEMSTSSGPSLLRYEVFALATLLIPSAYLYWSIRDDDIRARLGWAAGVAVICFASTSALIPGASAYLMKRGLTGFDRGKAGTPAGTIKM